MPRTDRPYRNRHRISAAALAFDLLALRRPSGLAAALQRIPGPSVEAASRLTGKPLFRLAFGVAFPKSLAPANRRWLLDPR